MASDSRLPGRESSSSGRSVHTFDTGVRGPCIRLSRVRSRSFFFAFGNLPHRLTVQRGHLGCRNLTALTAHTRPAQDHAHALGGDKFSFLLLAESAPGLLAPGLNSRLNSHLPHPLGVLLGAYLHGPSFPSVSPSGSSRM